MRRSYYNKRRTDSSVNKVTNVLVQLVPILLGGVFVFSGFVKAIDPLGSTYKFDDYFRAFGGFFEIFTNISFGLAILLSTLELMIGLSLLFKVYFRVTIYAALAFMGVMTPLTLYIALKGNLVTDCGCFGDALVIGNWPTFTKNIVLLAMVILMLLSQKKYRPIFTVKAQKIALITFFLLGFGLSKYCYVHQPLIDFRPYKVGVNIPQAMYVPENAPVDKYETTFIYEKNGQQKEFTLENYPKGDPAWKFVDQKTVLVSEGFKAPIHDFVIENNKYEDITEQILYDPGYTYLLIAYDLNKSSVKGAVEAEKMYQRALKAGAKFYALTASSDSQVLSFRQKTGVTFPFCKADPITLKTIIRANPGLMLIKNGTIQGKWNWIDFE